MHMCVRVCVGKGSYCGPASQMQDPISFLACYSGLRKSPLPRQPPQLVVIWWEDQCIPDHGKTTVRSLRAISCDHLYQTA